MRKGTRITKDVAMTPWEFMAWRSRMGLKVNDAAALLGYSRHWVYAVEQGKRRIGKAVAIACGHLEEEARERSGSFIVEPILEDGTLEEQKDEHRR